MLWHPGILAKYLVTDAVADSLGVATANLVVDQHVGEFGDIAVPVLDDDGRLAERTYQLTDARPDVPMGLHPPFGPNLLPSDLRPALASVDQGLHQIHDAVSRHSHAPNAARQMSLALADLMRDWVRPMVDITAAQLIATTLGRALLQRMVEDPQAAARTYNRAVAAAPEGGIGPLEVRDDFVELPVWKIDSTGRRLRGFDHDVAHWLNESLNDWLNDSLNGPAILPRALLMTALVRLGMCDLFVHGKGGAAYDRAMELWVKSWLGVEPSSIAVVTATLRLPLGEPITDQQAAGALAAARRAWHDPDSAVNQLAPSPAKQELVQAILSLPRRSRERRAAYARMHEQLAAWREGQARILRATRQKADVARQRLQERPIVTRRTWAFPLYPREMLASLASEARDAATSARTADAGERCVP